MHIVAFSQQKKSYQQHQKGSYFLNQTSDPPWRYCEKTIWSSGSVLLKEKLPQKRGTTCTTALLPPVIFLSCAHSTSVHPAPETLPTLTVSSCLHCIAVAWTHMHYTCMVYGSFSVFFLFGLILIPTHQ